MAKAENSPLLIKRYASRRLYNTETSDYVTLDDISGFIKEGRDVQIVDLKSGDDLTRQYLLQIIADNESRGESVLPINVLTDLVRSYTAGAGTMVPDFLSASFEMLREGQSKMVEQMSKPMSGVPGFDQIKAQQEAFMKTMMGGWTGGKMPGADDDADAESPKPESSDELDAIKKQLAEMQAALAKMGK
ncbi:polyhydroxyalkanoate synthesis repressor PhaR [Litoreibacter ponti]|uniref:Polyhydroxyalkanoate synthesis repressor PhaR n=1 Tax=Litoreibacter ponti TaxID=1510457 RepID=A0A2T6BK68_9RHOB|nr:polyhydroxyalkanoate synthesis repressor PhaR [Litoreibacter ponti]PTX56454.1 polyhydroxyalkanoate synthesis repressor PhaR [Litoreibacter ponti]